MGSVNLNVDGTTAFGGALPSVFVDAIEVDYETPEDGSDKTNERCIVNVTLSIKFTKPAGIQHGSVESFIENQLENLYLYAWLSPFDSQYATEHTTPPGKSPPDFNNKLESSELKLNYFLEYMKALSYSSTVTGKFEKYCKIQLGDFIAPGNAYDSELELLSSYDSEGNEIIQISNISLRFKYKKRFYTTSIDEDAAEYFKEGITGIHLPFLSDIEKLFLITAVGYDKDSLYEKSYDEVTRKAMDNTLNKFFGNITYCHILKHNQVPNQFYQMYSYADGSPFYGTPIQSLDGSFHATEGYDFESIRLSFQNMISEYSDTRESDPQLDNNIKSLEAIIYAEQNKTYVLGELSNYHSVYPNKAQDTLSGKFYSSFVLTMAEVMQQVNAQPPLTAKLLFDSLIVDNRAAKAAGSYIQPNLYTLYEPGYLSENISTSKSDDYINQAWHSQRRRTYVHDVMGGATSTTNDRYIELYGISNYAIGAHTVGQDEEYSSLLEELEDYYKDEEGLSTADAKAAAAAEASYLLAGGATEEGLEDRTDAARTAVASHLLNPSMSGDDIITYREGDTVVKNSGLFYFDWEKALRTRSLIAKALDLSLLEKYFNITIPYKYFRTEYVFMERRELPLAADMDGSISANTYLGVQMKSYMNTSMTCPLSKRQEYLYVKGDDSVNIDVSDDSSDSSRKEKYKYGHPYVFIGGIEYCSYVRFLNWDVLDDEHSRRLEGFNQVYTPSDIVEGARVSNGYRMMCFQYTDWMDDDVAYRNAWAPSSTRQPLISTINDGVDDLTMYRVQISVHDRTYEFWDYFVGTYITEIYDNFIEYSNVASEICAWNNITNTYNQFFIDGIDEKYAASTEKPWLIAAHTITALRAICAGTSFVDYDTFNQEVIRLALTISPQTGNLQDTVNARLLFNYLIRHLNSSIPALADAEALPAMTPQVVKENLYVVHEAVDHRHEFASTLLNNDPIYGDYYIPSSVDAATRSVAPMVIVRAEDPDGHHHQWMPVGNNNYYLSQYTDSDAIAIAFAQVFFPREEYGYGGAHMLTKDWTHDWKTQMYDGWSGRGSWENHGHSGRESHGAIAISYHPDGITEDDTGAKLSPPYPSTFEVAPPWSAFGVLNWYEPQILVNQIFRRSSTDVQRFDDGRASLRTISPISTSTRMYRLRDLRNLSELKYLLEEIYLPECQRRMSEDDHGYHQERGGGIYTDEATVAFRSAEDIESILPKIQEMLQDLIEATNNTIDYFLTHDSAPGDTHDPLRLRSQVSNENPVGPSGTLVSFTAWDFDDE